MPRPTKAQARQNAVLDSLLVRIQKASAAGKDDKVIRLVHAYTQAVAVGKSPRKYRSRDSQLGDRLAAQDAVAAKKQFARETYQRERAALAQRIRIQREKEKAASAIVSVPQVCTDTVNLPAPPPSPQVPSVPSPYPDGWAGDVPIGTTNPPVAVMPLAEFERIKRSLHE